ncbi:MAG: 2'-5' RNA ligase family protein [Clostridia bacterium]|nr:2'-5' RNA ligase family protein [Clostridia bacterium]
MVDKALYVMAGYDDDTEKYLAGIQNMLYEQGFTGVHTKNIPQHITLDSFPTEKENELIDFLEKLSETTESFDIAFNHVGIFSGSKVLFIAPDSSKELFELKEKFGSIFNWTPHTTMLIDEPDAIFKALPKVLNNFLPFQGKVTTLHLYEFWPTRHILSVKLK